LKILIVDDDALIRDGLKVLFEMEDDMEVIGVAVNAQQAFKICRNDKPDVILMDIRMPVMDGIEASKVIKEICPEIPIIIQTASVMGSAFEEISKSNCDDTIFKPIEAGKLIELIAKHFEK
jgi:DNA-binding NarL/FixJ family response regulator